MNRFRFCFRYILVRRYLRGLYFDWRWPEAKAYEGCCMCGSDVDKHGYGDGHSAVDMYHYYKGDFVRKGEDCTKWL